MTVGKLKKILENVDANLEVFVWNDIENCYEEAGSAKVEELFLLDCGEKIYNEETDDYETFIVFTIS